MRVSTKLSLVMSLTCFVVLGAYFVYQVRQERQDLSAAIERDLRLLGATTKVSVENALRDGQVDDVQATLAAMEEIAPKLDAFVFDEGQRLLAASPGSEEHLSLARDLAGSEVFRIEESRKFVRAILALDLLEQEEGGAPRGSLVLVKPLDTEQADMVRTTASIFLSAFLQLVGIAGAAILFARWKIRRPLAAMVASMRGLRAGAFVPPPASNSDDEIGEATREFDALVRDLREARAGLTAETEARRELESGLLRVDKLVTVGQLAAGLAHEIGSPLQILNGRARALLNAADEPAEVRRHAEILVAQTDRVSRIVEQLLGFSRRMPPALVDCPLPSIAESVVALLDHPARRKGVKLELEAEPGLPPVRVDRDRIQQVVLNLVTNALRATPAGGRIRVAVGRGPRPAELRLSVEDTGCGMDEPTRRRAFEPFFTTAPESGGTGLGLATASQIVLEHAGRIAVESEPGRGSRFVVDLPLQRPEERP
ncbi:MAG TPA: ATP-binding protein [Myxococcales bacterium]|jgi:signal transduction histidine kinase